MNDTHHKQGRNRDRCQVECYVIDNVFKSQHSGRDHVVTAEGSRNDRGSCGNQGCSR